MRHTAPIFGELCQMTKTYKTEVLLSITTGILLCDFGQLHECCEFLIDSPIWTHQFAHRPLVETLKSAVLHQHPQLGSVNSEGVGCGNWAQFRDRMIEQFGAELQLTSIGLCNEDFSESFNEPLKGMTVIPVALHG